MKKILNLGLNQNLPNTITERIKLTNKIGLLLLLFSLVYVALGIAISNVLAYFVIAGNFVVIIALLANYFDKTTIGRFILSIYPALTCSILGAVLSSAQNPLSYSQFGLIVMSCIFPFILFSYSEKIYITISFGICVALMLGFNTLNRIIELDNMPYDLFLKPEIHLLNSIICAAIIFICLDFLLNAEKKISSNNTLLLKDLDEKNKAFEKSEADLRNYIEQFKAAKVFEEQVNWQNLGITQLAEVIRNNNGKDDIFKHIISFIAKYTNALKGLLYVYSHGKNILMYGAGYGVPKQDGINDQLKLGEGLAGQCMKEKDIIHLTEIPEDFIKIDSGLGEAIPKTVILLPIQNDNSSEGVLELAFFSQLLPHEIEFLKKISEILSTVISNEKVNRRTTKIMEQLQISNNEVKAQEEELRQNLEELHATQEEMRRAQKETELKEAYLNALINNTTDSIIELDKNYRVLIINDTILNRYKGTAYEGIQVGACVLDYFTGDMAKEWKAYYDRGLAGEQYKFTMPSTVAGENYTRHYNINPVKNKNGEIIGVSVFSRDIAEMKA